LRLGAETNEKSKHLNDGLIEPQDVRRGRRRYETCSGSAWGKRMMSLVHLLGFTTLSCGCLTGRYRELATNRQVTYVEEKGVSCNHHGHRKNHTLAPARFGMATAEAKAS